jgi:hypothetical protein
MYYPGADLALSVDAAARELVKAEGAIQLVKSGLWIVPGLLLSTTRKADKVDDGGDAPKGAAGFRSFDAFKRAQGPAGPGMHWHHVVEQTPGNLGRFGAETVHNTGNLIRVEAGTHGKISGFYLSTQEQVTGSSSLTVRQWLSAQSFEKQQEFGTQVLKQFGVLK